MSTPLVAHPFSSTDPFVTEIPTAFANPWVALDLGNESGVSLQLTIGGNFYLLPAQSTGRYYLQGYEQSVNVLPLSAPTVTGVLFGIAYDASDQKPDLSRGSNFPGGGIVGLPVDPLVLPAADSPVLGMRTVGDLADRWLLRASGQIAVGDGINLPERVFSVREGLPWFDVRAFGAVGDGSHDDTANIQEAIDAANAVIGGVVFFPIGLYKITGPLTMYSGIWLVGASSPMGFNNVNPLLGAVFLISDTGFDVISTNPAAQVQGCAIQNLGFSGSSGASNWDIHIYDSVGMILRNLAFRQATTGANGIFFDGNSSGCYQSVLDHLSFNCGLGHLGGTALKLGGASFYNYNNGHSIATLGYAKGIHFNSGAGNTIIGAWQQFCTVGIQFDATIAAVIGGWTEANGTAFSFGPASTGNLVSRVRNAGGHTVEFVHYDGTKNTVDENDFPSTTASTWKAAVHSNLAQLIPDNLSTKLTLPGVEVNDGNYVTGTSSYVVPAAGTYQVSGRVEFTTALPRCLVQVYSNGAEIARGTDGPNASSEISVLLQLNKGDVINLVAFQLSGAAQNTFQGQGRTYFAINFVSF